ncbi:hypothetical protein [Tritonibacter mobilis]|uniref:hypothetical protein n=1 Tax=Tritonibacter mobilis TaxID=379347 RepID=UPI003A5BE8B2
MKTNKTQDCCIEFSINKFMEVWGSAFSNHTHIDLLQDSTFECIVFRHSDQFFLHVTKGIEVQISLLWAKLKLSGALKTPNTPQLFQHSLDWLLLHEMSHIELKHLDFADAFGVVQRPSLKQKTFYLLSKDMRPLAPLCLEMQADHEATDVLLGPYATNDWQGLREKVLAISGMAMLIELEDTKNGADGRTHPKAATRVFQLLGHLAEMPLIRAQLDQDTSLIPREDELRDFVEEVTIPCYFDAVHLAQAAGAASIESDLGNPEDFFRDVEVAKLGNRTKCMDFKTQGAKEWNKLWCCNQLLKPMLCESFQT